MTGFVGGTLGGSDLQTMADSLYQEEWYTTKSRRTRNAGLSIVEHGDRDSQSNVLWKGEQGVGVIHGVVSNRNELGWSDREIFERIFERPARTLETLEGPFALACYDRRAEAFYLATDKVGSRPCYYAVDDGLFFGSELKVLLEHCAGPTINEQAVGDLLLMGFVIGDKTLVDGIANLPPATYLTYTSGSVHRERYWRPGLDPLPERGYVDGWIDSHQRAMDNLTEPIVDQHDDRLSLWLSGGLDSRATAGALKKGGHAFDTITYEDGGKDGEIAKQVADRLGTDHRTMDRGSPHDFARSVRNAVDVTDGMMAWSFVPNLSTMFSELHRSADVVMEGGTFLGEDIWHHDLKRGTSAVDIAYKRRMKTTPSQVASLLSDPVDPKQSLREEVATSGFANTARSSLDTVRRLYSYSHMRSNIVQRSQVGTRVVSDGRFIDYQTKKPDGCRMKAIPFTGGKLPQGTPRIKLEVVRKYNSGLDRVPYARTGLPPSYPYHAHVAGFGLTETLGRVGSSEPGPYTRWYQNVPEVREFIDGLLDDASERHFFDTAGIEALRRSFLEGESKNITAVAGITGLELWMQEHVDTVQQRARVTV